MCGRFDGVFVKLTLRGSFLASTEYKKTRKQSSIMQESKADVFQCPYSFLE